MFLHYGDLTDSTNLMSIISKVNPTEIYNLGAQSHVKVSFDMSEALLAHPYTLSPFPFYPLPPLPLDPSFLTSFTSSLLH